MAWNHFLLSVMGFEVHRVLVAITDSESSIGGKSQLDHG